METERTFLTPTDLSERWAGASLGGLANMRAAGRGPTFTKIGARVLYSLAAVQAYEASRSIQCAA